MGDHNPTVSSLSDILTKRNARITKLEKQLADARNKVRDLNRRCQQAESAAASVEKQVREAEIRGAEQQVKASKCVHYADRDAQWERAMHWFEGEGWKGRHSWTHEQKVAAIRERLDPPCCPSCGQPSSDGRQCEGCDTYTEHQQ